MNMFVNPQPNYANMTTASEALLVLKQAKMIDPNRVLVASDGAQEVLFITDSSEKELNAICAKLNASGTHNPESRLSFVLNFGAFPMVSSGNGLADFKAPAGSVFKLFNTETHSYLMKNGSVVNFDSYVGACNYLFHKVQDGNYIATEYRVSY